MGFADRGSGATLRMSCAAPRPCDRLLSLVDEPLVALLLLFRLRFDSQRIELIALPPLVPASLELAVAPMLWLFRRCSPLGREVAGAGSYAAPVRADDEAPDLDFKTFIVLDRPGG